MIQYSAIAELSAVILIIFFLSPAILASMNKGIFTRLYRIYSLINLLLFGLTIILAVIGNSYSVIFLIVSLVFMGYSLNYMITLFEISRNFQL